MSRRILPPCPASPNCVSTQARDEGHAIALQALEDDGQPYENIEEVWPDYPTKEDFMFNEDEY